ncbi:Proton-dependent oligopeptide transporter family, partial [Dillenia turbinata]
VLAATNADKDRANDEAIVDYQGNPVDNSRTGGWHAAGLILGTELSERICVMGISMNLVTYLVGQLHLSSSTSATVGTNFMALWNILGLFVDAIFGSIAALGVILLTLATTIPSMRPPQCGDARKEQCIVANDSQLAMLYAALYTIALGGGGIKSNVSGFGLDIGDPKEEKTMIFFFNRFYFCISMGSLFAVTVLVYIQDNVGRGWSHGISAGTMVITITILICGRRLYRYKKPQGSPLTVIWRVLFLAVKKQESPYPAHPSLLNQYHNANVPHTERFRCLDKAAVMDDHAATKGNSTDPWIVSTLEEVKMVLKLIPIWSTCILFWTIYSQMTTFTIEQATFMNRNIGSFVIPSGSFSFFLFITILLFTSLNERIFVPIARKFTHTVQGITSLQRVGVGLVFSIVAMVVSAVIEKLRREAAVTKDTQISAFWLVPQFFLVGAGEAFAYVGQLEFFIREAPERMKSMSTGLFLSTLAMGFFVSSLLVSLVEDVTDGIWLRIGLLHWMLAILGFINFLVFLVFATRHQYRVQQPISSNQDGEKELQSWTDGAVAEC